MKAMILAAGRGNRMRPLTDTLPKPLIEVGGKPLIAWHLEALARAGITNIVINHSHLGMMIESALGNGSRYSVHINYSSEVEALESAGGIAYALPLIGNDPFLVINGDIHCDYDFSRLKKIAAVLIKNHLLAHLVLVDNPSHHPEGDFVLIQDKVLHEGKPKLTFSGIGVYQPQLFKNIERGAKARLANLLIPAMQEAKISGERFAGFWEDVGTPERLKKVRQRLENRVI